MDEPTKQRERLSEGELSFLLRVRHDTTHLRPGDRVDIIGTFHSLDDLLSGEETSTSPEYISYPLVSSARVLALHERSVELALTNDELRVLTASSHHSAAGAFNAVKRFEGDRASIPFDPTSSKSAMDAITVISTPRCVGGGSCSNRTWLDSMDRTDSIASSFERGTRLYTFDSPRAHARFEPGQEIGLMMTWSERAKPPSRTISIKTLGLYHRLLVHSVAQDSLTVVLEADHVLSVSSLESKSTFDVVVGAFENPEEDMTLRGLIKRAREANEAK